MTISLNGPLTDCDSASKAFSEAFGKPIIYEQVSYESYRETLIEANMPVWQVNGILELFQAFEMQEPFCRHPEGPKELGELLGRPASTILDLAKAAVAISHGETTTNHRTSSDGSSGTKSSPPQHSDGTSKEFKEGGNGNGSNHDLSEGHDITSSSSGGGGEGSLGYFGIGKDDYGPRTPERERTTSMGGDPEKEKRFTFIGSNPLNLGHSSKSSLGGLFGVMGATAGGSKGGLD